MEKKAEDGGFYKWLFVLPAFLICFIVLSVFKYAADLILIHPLVGRNLQLEFILDHIYFDLFCVGASLYFSCLVAPKFRVRLALIYTVLILFATPRRLELAESEGFYGYYPWKISLLISLYVLSCLIPILLLLRERYVNKTLDNEINQISGS